MKVKSSILRFYGLLFIAGLHLLSVSLAHAYSCDRYLSLQKLDVVENDTAVELELKRTNRVLKLLTTTTGKVDAILGNLPPPEWLVEFAKNAYAVGINPLEVEWDDLSVVQQVDLLKYVSQDKDFWRNREFVGLKVRDTITFRFEKPTAIMGVVYPAGNRQVPIGQYFKKVEYKSHSGVQTVSGFELHFRAAEGAGQLSNDAWQILDLAKVERPSQHVHIVALMPDEELKANRVLIATKIADYYRRLNLGLEMITVMNRNTGIAVRKSVDGTAIYFGPISSQNVQQVYDSFFYNYSGTVVHIGWAGFRGKGYYDNRNLWGIEVRSVSKRLPPEIHREILDSVQNAIVSRDFGISDPIMETWISRNDDGFNRLGQKVSALWYRNQSSGLTSPLVYNEAGFTDEQWRTLTERNLELNMLTHDWSNDTLIAANPDLLEQILAERKIALASLKTGVPANRVIRRFLKNSGLYYATLNSIGLGLADPL